jgi:hypothetical protein
VRGACALESMTPAADAPVGAGADVPGGGSGRAEAGDGLPDPDASPCADCGHVWFEGERHHEHVTGLPPPGFRTGRVEVVCVPCRQQRERRPPGD